MVSVRAKARVRVRVTVVDRDIRSKLHPPRCTDLRPYNGPSFRVRMKGAKYL